MMMMAWRPFVFLLPSEPSVDISELYVVYSVILILLAGVSRATSSVFDNSRNSLLRHHHVEVPFFLVFGWRCDVRRST
jgi:hypothetical protein